MKTVKKAVDYRKNSNERLAGGFGAPSANQKAEALLRRATMSCLLWEDLAYESGKKSADNIANLIPKVDGKVCSEIAIEARNNQKLRHVPLFIAREMSRYKTHSPYVAETLDKIVQRADELAEFLAIYWKDGKQPISKQIKKGLSKAFEKFDEYHFSKYKGNRNDVKLKDVINMVCPKPKSKERHDLYWKIRKDTLEVPDTWEVALSAGKDKKSVWERLINENKLGALAFLRNLRNMEEVSVDRDIINKGFNSINPKWLLPLNYLASAKHAPRWEAEIEKLMLKGFDQTDKLKGHTIFVVDVSGSMDSSISDKSEFTRLEVAKAMAVMASSVCEKITVYATAGNDASRIHSTTLVPSRRGFGLMSEIGDKRNIVGGGGIFTVQCLDYIKEQERGVSPDRVIIFSDSQDCDNKGKIPKPFGKYNYIIDVSSHSHGINYDGVWTAEISGWSERFIPFIMSMEGVSLQNSNEDE